MNLLWTGGWDSTFRLLHLVLINQKPVQPYYIVDTARRSSLLELKTMHRVRKSIAKMSADAAARIRPTIIASIHDIQPDPGITAKYKALKRKGHLGGQYEWLARFVKQSDMARLELCIHVDDRAHGFLEGHMTWIEAEDRSGYWVLQDRELPTDLQIFKFFDFPLLNLTKAQMQELARQNGFLHIMEQTWFCFNPTHGKPCGLCHPCRYAIEEGMQRRMPRAALVRNRLQPLYARARRAKQKISKMMRRSLR